MKRIDLNADLGESQAALLDGTQAALLCEITSANIACGGHAGDPVLMRATVEQCQSEGVSAGAHPSYPDRENFGRTTLDMALSDLTASIAEQLHSLQHLARELGVAITHLKPHGALYNDAAKDPQLAQAIVHAAVEYPNLILYGLRGSIMIDVFRQAGFRTAAEVFADRAYQPDGSLRPRHLPGALITDPDEAAANALKLAESKADTICVHSDTPNAIAIARAVRAKLVSHGFTIGPI
jgi:UPF0271 protein